MAVEQRATGVPVPVNAESESKEDEDDNEESGDTTGKKKRKKNKKAKQADSGERPPLRVLGEWPADCHPDQKSFPPETPVSQ